MIKRKYTPENCFFQIKAAVFLYFLKSFSTYPGMNAGSDIVRRTACLSNSCNISRLFCIVRLFFFAIYKEGGLELWKQG